MCSDLIIFNYFLQIDILILFLLDFIWFDLFFMSAVYMLVLLTGRIAYFYCVRFQRRICVIILFVFFSSHLTW